jgi:hypothetical protein
VKKTKRVGKQEWFAAVLSALKVGELDTKLNAAMAERRLKRKKVEPRTGRMSPSGQDQSSECFGRMTGLSALQTNTMPSVKVGLGSKCDLRHRLVSRLECDGEPTFGPERRLCGGDRT